MAKLVVVQNDAVEGTDKHNVAGQGQPPGSAPPAPAAWVASYTYRGKMTDALSDLLSIDARPAATVSSQSSLNPGETAPGGGHYGDSGSGFVPPSPTPIVPGLSITDPVGVGRPSVTSGSSFVKVDGSRVLLDGDKIDTCDGLGIPMNSTVTASGQSFVSCSA